MDPCLQPEACEGHEVRGRRRPEVGEHAVRRVAVAREVDELDTELARELRAALPRRARRGTRRWRWRPQGEINAYCNELYPRETGRPGGLLSDSADSTAA